MIMGIHPVPMIIDRLEREHEYGELHCDRPVLDYFTSGNFYVGCEGNERALSSVVRILSVHNRACSHPISLMKFRWRKRAMRSMKSKSDDDITKTTQQADPGRKCQEVCKNSDKEPSECEKRNQLTESRKLEVEAF